MVAALERHYFRVLVNFRFLHILIMVSMVAMLAGPGLPRASNLKDPPEYKLLRYEEDYTYLRDADPSGFLDRIKYIPYADGGEMYLSIGGEIRYRYEYTHNPAWGQDPQDEYGVFLHRYVLHGDWHINSHLRFFGQLYSALENGREQGPSPVDEDQLTVQNAFLDLGLDLPAKTRLTLRGGRQEIKLGSGRLVNVREGPNLRRKFDGFRLLLDITDWQISAIATRLAKSNRGVFDDGMDEQQALWGLYAQGQPTLLRMGKTDIYYLGYRNDRARYQQGTGEETRHTLGARLWGDAGGWAYNWEFDYQWGAFGSGNIQAWSAASITGYRWHTLPLSPYVGISANIASGDEDPVDPDLQTFNPLFPRGDYFSELSLLGPRNFYNLNPLLILNLTPDVSLTTGLNFFWRLSKEDGVYSPNGQLLRASGDSDERFVGSSISLSNEWRIKRHFFLNLVYAHFFPGPFIEDTGPSADIDFYEFTLTFKF
jgi:hypothetical protein